ncbi:hypothetical protein [Blastococcus sp. SYSU D01042]
MRIAGRFGAPVLILAGLVAAGCGPAEDARPEQAADASYEAPAGTPAFCTRLASVEELGELPLSVGLLVAGDDVEARTGISQVVRELRGVLSDVRDGGGPEDLATALDGLVASLGSVVDGPLTDAVLRAVSAGLAEVGATAQPVCEFAT